MQRKIKILECIRQGQIGGGESHLLSLVENLDRTKFDPVVLSFTDGPMIEQLKKMHVPTHVIHTLKPFDFTKWGKVKEFIKEQNADLVHAHGTRAASNVLWASKSLKLPVIYTVHGWSFHQDQKPMIRKIRIMGEKYISSRTDLNISVSQSNQLSGKDFIPSFTSVVINNGIDQKKFNPENTITNLRSELNIGAEKILVLFIARFTSHKQPLALLRAFADAFPKNKNMHLLMVGDGDEKDDALRIVKETGLEEHVTFQPFRQDVPAVLAAADIFVLPSLWEGLPIGLLEAMAMGKAIIATNVDGTKEIIQHEQNGILVSTDGLIKNLSSAIVSLSMNGDKRALFQQNARETVKQRFDAADMTRKIEAEYEKLINKYAPEKKGSLAFK
jgi:glycosyltransferase involved in cell wall biosynthesis